MLLIAALQMEYGVRQLIGECRCASTLRVVVDTSGVHIGTTLRNRGVFQRVGHVMDRMYPCRLQVRARDLLLVICELSLFIVGCTLAPHCKTAACFSMWVMALMYPCSLQVRARSAACYVVAIVGAPALLAAPTYASTVINISPQHKPGLLHAPRVTRR